MKTALDAVSALAATGAALVLAVHLGRFAADQGFEGRSRGYGGGMLLALALGAVWACCRIAGCCLFP